MSYLQCLSLQSGRSDADAADVADAAAQLPRPHRRGFTLNYLRERRGRRGEERRREERR